MAARGRPASCLCGECRKCRDRLRKQRARGSQPERNHADETVARIAAVGDLPEVIDRSMRRLLISRHLTALAASKRSQMRDLVIGAQYLDHTDPRNDEQTRKETFDRQAQGWTGDTLTDTDRGNMEAVQGYIEERQAANASTES